MSTSASASVNVESDAAEGSGLSKLNMSPVIGRWGKMGHRRREDRGGGTLESSTKFRGGPWRPGADSRRCCAASRVPVAHSSRRGARDCFEGGGAAPIGQSAPAGSFGVYTVREKMDEHAQSLRRRRGLRRRGTTHCRESSSEGAGRERGRERAESAPGLCRCLGSRLRDTEREQRGLRPPPGCGAGEPGVRCRCDCGGQLKASGLLGCVPSMWDVNGAPREIARFKRQTAVDSQSKTWAVLAAGRRVWCVPPASSTRGYRMKLGGL